jgi:hypothetical protein
MRVLLLPTVYETSADLSGLSEWSHHLDVAKSLARLKLPVFLYIAVPHQSEKIRYDERLFDLPNVKVLSYQPRGYYGMPDEWVGWLSVYRNQVPFDMVWNDCWWHNLLVGVLVRESSYQAPTVVNMFHEGPRAPEVRVHSEGFPLVDLQILGGFLQDLGVVMTEYQRKLLLEIARERLSPASVHEIDARMVVLPPAVDLSRVDRHRERFDRERQERKELVVFAVGGLKESKRQFPAIAEVVKRLQDRGLPIRMKVRTQSQEGVGCGSRLETLGVDVEYGCLRERYLSGLGDADVVVDATKDEVTGLANIEAVLSGAQYVAVRYPWMEGRVPPWYPLCVNSLGDLEPVLALMAADKVRFRDVAGRLERHYRETFDSDVVAFRFVETLYKAMEVARPFRVSPSLAELVGASVVGKEAITLPELYQEMRKRARSQTVDWSRGTKVWNQFVARRALEACGFVDRCDGPEPVFEGVKGG